jgi:hypothetical protein
VNKQFNEENLSWFCFLHAETNFFSFHMRRRNSILSDTYRNSHISIFVAVAFEILSEFVSCFTKYLRAIYELINIKDKSRK